MTTTVYIKQVYPFKWGTAHTYEHVLINHLYAELESNPIVAINVVSIEAEVFSDYTIFISITALDDKTHGVVRDLLNSELPINESLVNFSLSQLEAEDAISIHVHSMQKLIDDISVIHAIRFHDSADLAPTSTKTGYKKRDNNFEVKPTPRKFTNSTLSLEVTDGDSSHIAYYNWLEPFFREMLIRKLYTLRGVYVTGSLVSHSIKNGVASSLHLSYSKNTDVDVVIKVAQDTLRTLKDDKVLREQLLHVLRDSLDSPYADNALVEFHRNTTAYIGSQAMKKDFTDKHLQELLSLLSIKHTLGHK